MVKSPTKPLYPSYLHLTQFQLNDYPQVKEYLNELPSWCTTNWQWGKDFLSYTGRNKSEHTYIRFRNERDATLTAPRLLLPSIQINIDGGELPIAEDNGSHYIKIPLRK